MGNSASHRRKEALKNDPFQTTVHERVLEALDRHSATNFPAITEAPVYRTITHGELRDKVLRMASFFVKKGLEPGGIITLILPNSIEYMVCSIGAMTAGGCIDAVLPDAGYVEICMHIALTHSKIIVTVESLLEKAMKHQTSYYRGAYRKDIEVYICIRDPSSADPLPEGVFDFEEAMAEMPMDKPVSVSPRDPVQVVFTPATNGELQGVLHSHHAFADTLYRWQRHWELEFYPSIGIHNVDWYYVDQLLTLPACHFNGFAPILMYLITGSPIYLLREFDEEICAKMIDKYCIRALTITPHILKYLLQNEHAKAAYLSYLQIIFTTAPCDASVCEQLLKRVKRLKHIVQGYGMTELCGFADIPMAFNKKFYDVLGVINGVSVPCCQHKIVNSITGAPCSIEEPGELWIKSELRMIGYLNKPEATAEILDKDGFINTGDNAFVDEEGLVHIIGTNRECITVKGVSVSPIAIEKTLTLINPKNAEVVVVGVPDEEVGEKIHAVIVRTADGRGMMARDAREDVEDNMSSYNKITGDVHFVKSIPKSASGKVNRRTVLANITEVPE